MTAPTLTAAPANRLARVLAAAAPATGTPAPAAQPTPVLCECDDNHGLVGEKPTTEPVVAENATTRPPLDNLRTRASLFYCARLLLGGSTGQLYPGAIRVSIRAPELGERRTFEPTADTSGLPAFVPTVPTAPAAADRSAPAGLSSEITVDALLRTFLSDAEKAILKVLAALPAGRTLSAETVKRESRVASEFWPVWRQLQIRGLVEEAKGPRAGYRLAVEWVRELVN